MRYACFIIFVGMPTPSGVFGPAMILGGIFGRVYAEVFNYMFFNGI
jgi:H+/Cl- antiporter ClcA